MGIARGEEYAFVSSFCFVFPDATGPVPDGHIHSQTIVSSPGHKFLVVNQSDLQEGRSCEELVRRAKVIEPLTERSLEVIAYDLTLNVEPSMSRQQISTIIARCGEQVSAEYIVELTSPGGLFERHFACSDRGLLSGYLWCTLVVCVTSSFFYSACRMLHHRQAHNDISAIFFYFWRILRCSCPPLHRASLRVRAQWYGSGHAALCFAVPGFLVYKHAHVCYNGAGSWRIHPPAMCTSWERGATNAVADLRRVHWDILAVYSC